MVATKPRLKNPLDNFFGQVYLGHTTVGGPIAAQRKIFFFDFSECYLNLLGRLLTWWC